MVMAMAREILADLSMRLFEGVSCDPEPIFVCANYL
jgi:hypothetical protein